MVSILPAQRSSFDVIGDLIGQNLSQNLPRAIEQGQQRQRAYDAIDQLQKGLQTAGNDPSKILPLLARTYTDNPVLERSGLGQTYLNRALTANAFGNQGATTSPQTQSPVNRTSPQPSTNAPQPTETQPSPVENIIGKVDRPEEAATPSPFNLFTSEDIDKKSEDFAIATNNPANYSVRQSQLQNLNEQANRDRSNLEDMASKSGIPSDELARFMNVGSRFDTRNPSQWLEKTKQKYKEVKSNFDQLERAFIPDIGSGLLGRNREGYLKRLEEPVRNLVKSGLEDDVREYLANQYLSPTEISELVRPMNNDQRKALETFPKGEFRTKPLPQSDFDIFGLPAIPRNNYEEMQVTDPDKIQGMNEKLADFFLDNVNKETSLLPLRHDLVMEKDYDWRQIPDALRIAQEKGLKLTPRQQTELVEINTQSPRQSLGEIFQDWGRIVQYFRGNK